MTSKYVEPLPHTVNNFNILYTNTQKDKLLFKKHIFNLKS